jgi:hypothetical protein
MMERAFSLFAPFYRSAAQAPTSTPAEGSAEQVRELERLREELAALKRELAALQGRKG